MQQKVINILFGIIIVMLTGVVLYLTFGNKSVPVVEPIPTPVKTTVKPAVVATDETADWKTYTDTNFSYSFKYPATYNVKGIGSEVQIYASPNTNDGQWIVNFSGEKTSAILSSLVKTKTDDKVLSEAIPATVNGLPAYEGISQGMINWYSVLVKNNSSLVEIKFNETDKGSFIQNKSALTSIQKQILSTFKFIDGVSNSTTTNWQIYNNEKLKFRLQYPNDWRAIGGEDGVAFGPVSIREDTLFGISVVSKIPTLDTKEENYEITKIDVVSFNDYPAMKIYTKNLSVDMEWSNLYIEKNGVILSIGQPTLNNSDFPFENKYNNVVTQILSTFEFTK